MTHPNRVRHILVLLLAAACDPAGPEPGLVMTIGDTEIDGTYSRGGAVVRFHAEALENDRGGRLELDIAGKPLEVTIDMAGQLFVEDAQGSTFSLADRALLLALRDVIGVEHPEIIDTVAGSLLVRAADRYAEVPIGRPRTRLEINLADTGEGDGGKADKVENYACKDDGTTCFPGTYGQSWAVFGSDAIGGCFAKQAYYGDSVCRGRCGAGCSWWDEDYMWDCFDHDVCLDYTNSCDFEWDDASDDWVVTWGPYCSSGSTRQKPPSVPVCGNGTLEAGEACDDFNTNSNDGCSATCQIEVVSVALAHSGLSVTRDQRVQLRATATFGAGNPVDVTSTAAWSSANPAIAAVAAGQITGIAAGTTVVTVSIAGHTAEVTVGVRDVACTLAINELVTAGVTAADEWVELHNSCSAPIDATGWTLVYRSAGATGSADSYRLATLAGAIEPGQFRLYASASSTVTVIADGTWTQGTDKGAIARLGGGVGLRNAAGTLVESIAYGSAPAAHPFAEGGVAAPVAPAGASCERGPFDGADLDVNGSDFALTEVGTATPRASNTP